jgi:hypothetical protein
VYSAHPSRVSDDTQNHAGGGREVIFGRFIFDVELMEQMGMRLAQAPCLLNIPP